MAIIPLPKFQEKELSGASIQPCTRLKGYISTVVDIEVAGVSPLDIVDFEEHFLGLN